MTLAINDVVIPKKGNAASSTSEKLQPLVKAKVKPATHMAKAKIIEPIFSPRAFCIAAVSLLNLAESSEGLVVSNHELSCLKIDLRYSVRVFLVTRSLNNSKNEYMMSDVIHTAIPTQVKINDIVLMVSIVSSTVVVGLNESITLPMRNTNDGIPQPVIQAAIHPKYIYTLSDDDAN